MFGADLFWEREEWEEHLKIHPLEHSMYFNHDQGSEHTSNFHHWYMRIWNLHQGKQCCVYGFPGWQMTSWYTQWPLWCRSLIRKLAISAIHISLGSDADQLREMEDEFNCWMGFKNRMNIVSTFFVKMIMGPKSFILHPKNAKPAEDRISIGFCFFASFDPGVTLK